MAQIDNKFSAFWMDTSTAPWTPITWLSATILIKLAEDPYTVVVNNEPMTDIWNWDYIYEFTWYDSSKNYIYHCNPWATAYIESGVTDKRLDHIDKNLSDISVWWNPYIEWIGWIKEWIQKVANKVESKWNEIIKKIQETEWQIIKTFPEYKEPVVNVTTEKIDTTEFINAIKEIKPEVTVTTEQIDTTPLMDAIKEIGKISEIEIPEQKEVDLSKIENSIEIINDTIDEMKWDIIDKIDEKKNLYEAVGSLFETAVNKKEKRDKEEIEEENISREIPESFTANLS